MEVAIKRNKILFISLIFSLFLFFGIISAEPAALPEKIELPDEAVSSKMLDNGLIVLAKSTTPQDLVSIFVVVRSGSSTEKEYAGSGISHLVEHMIFKGTKTRKTGDIDKEIRSYGGFSNGSVSQDLTEFHITLPSKYLPQAISILKDMLLNASFDKNEFDKEKEVILKEIRLNNDEPQSKMFQLLNQTAYIRHPYKYPVIGYEKNFSALTREDAVKYYNRMYVPNRIAIAVVGGIDDKDAVSIVEKEFVDFRPADYGLMDTVPSEPVQIDNRFLEEEAPISLSYLAMGFHSTSLLSEDLFAMDVLAIILGRGDNSRLNAELFKNKRLVHNISCWNYTPKDPGLFVISAILDKDKTDAAERSISEEIKKIKDAGPGDEELETARRMVLGDYIFSLQTTEAQAGDMAQNYILSGSYDLSRRYVRGIQAVTKQDVKRAANRYLRPDNLTTIKLLPPGAELVVSKQAVSAVPDTIKKAVLPNGLIVLARENKKTPTVSVTVAMLGGLMTENVADNGISNLTAAMLLKGTASRKEHQVVGSIESRGGSVAAFSSFNSFGINMELLKPDVAEGLNVLKDILANSTFPPGELEKVKTQICASIRQEDDDIFNAGINALKKQLFEGSPYALRYLGTTESVGSIARQQIMDYYKSYCIPNNMVISISGDIPTDEAINKIKDMFGDLKKGRDVIRPSTPAKPGSVKEESFEMDREESLVMMGFMSVGTCDPDKYPIEVLTGMLSGQSGRMFRNLRGTESLAYTLGCFQKTALNTGFVAFYAATVKSEIAKIETGIRGEIRALKEKLAGEEELNDTKRELVSARRLSMQTNSFYSFTSAIDELYGLGHDNLYKYEAGIENVTKEDIKRVADKYLDMNAYAEIVISSKK